MKLGFQGWAAFYDLFDSSSDPFNSYDRKGRVIDDYQTCYMNSLRTRIAMSRRLEAWYLGLTEFKLEKFCRERIEQLRSASKDVSAAVKRLESIITQANAPGSDLDIAAKQLLALAEQLDKEKNDKSGS